jgi:hypothetical protein
MDLKKAKDNQKELFNSLRTLLDFDKRKTNNKLLKFGMLLIMYTV